MINEHNFLLLSFMFSFTHTFPTLVNILKTTVACYGDDVDNIVKSCIKKAYERLTQRRHKHKQKQYQEDPSQLQ
jgi:hypothetical protein